MKELLGLAGKTWMYLFLKRALKVLLKNYVGKKEDILKS
jgi:hypothetical protein